MNFFSYKIEHDYGLAPNPFHGFCTLAVCKSQIRNNRNLKTGDWVIGTGTKSLGNLHHIIFAMEVQEIISYNQYWKDDRFLAKKPLTNGSLVQMYGDNIYHTDEETGDIIQENSAHSSTDKEINQDHIIRDTGGKNVLISKNFYYFGNHSPLIPKEFLEVCCEGRDFKYAPSETAICFLSWLNENYKIGIHGDPISWSEHLK